MAVKLSDLLREIEKVSPRRPENLAQLQSQSKHAYEAARRFIQQIEKLLPPEEADDLIKRFINAIRTADERKLERGFDKLTGDDKENT